MRSNKRIIKGLLDKGRRTLPGRREEEVRA